MWDSHSLSKIDLEPLEQYVMTSVPDHFVNKPGTSPYALYAKIASELPQDSLIADLGTLQGLSALAMSLGQNSKIISYDIDMKKNIVQREGIEFIEKNCFDDLDRILTADLILVDVDPHDGQQEKRFFDILLEREYHGMTLWDDIHLNQGMQAFWNYASKQVPVTDLTSLGHYTGTGKVEF